MASTKYISLDGKLVPYEDAKIHVQSVAAKYGGSVFEGICGYANPEQKRLFLFRLDDHLKRLQFSMKVMRFKAEFTLDEVRRWLMELLLANDMEGDAHIRVVAYVDGRGGMEISSPVGVWIVAQDHKRPAHAESGNRCCVSSWARISDRSLPPRVKAAANYMNGRLARIEALERGFNDAILLTERGTVAEAPGACVFIVRDGVPVTSGTTSGILESITRATVIRLFADRFGQTVIEREIDRTELYAADEIFLCGSNQEVRPVIDVDGLPVGTGGAGPLTSQIRKAYFDVVRGNVADHPEWRTAVVRSN